MVAPEQIMTKDTRQTLPRVRRGCVPTLQNFAPTGPDLRSRRSPLYSAVRSIEGNLTEARLAPPLRC
jgi:hypothetical protein